MVGSVFKCKRCLGERVLKDPLIYERLFSSIYNRDPEIFNLINLISFLNDVVLIFFYLVKINK